MGQAEVRDLPDAVVEPRSPALQADALTSEPAGKPLSRKEWLKASLGRSRRTPRRNDKVTNQMNPKR